MGDLDESQVDYLEDALGLNLNGTKAVADDTVEYFVERCDEEGLSVDEMLAAIRTVEDHVEEAVEEAR